MILAHNYMTPEVFHCVSDIVGDSLALAREAIKVDAKVTAAEVPALRTDYPGVTILAHPECPPEVIAEADYTGSTADVSAFVGRERPRRVVLLTECSMADNVSVGYPEIEFVRPCNLCPHMKRITLPKILHALGTMTEEVTIDPALAERARRSVERMLEVR